MKKNVLILMLVLGQMLGAATAIPKTLKLVTQGQKWGVMDIDVLYVSSAKSTTNAIRIQGENCSRYTVGSRGGRYNAVNGWAWIQFGCEPNSPYYLKPGYVAYNLDLTGRQYICVRYSKDSNSTVPVEIWLDDKKLYTFYPANQGSWEKFNVSEWFALDFGISTTPYLTIEPLSKNVSSESGSATFNVSSNQVWGASTSSSWISVTKSSNTLLTVIYTKNTNTSSRTGNIVCTAKGINPVTVKLEQQAAFVQLYDTLTLSTTGQDFGVADLARLWISSDNTTVNAIVIEGWNPISYSTGQLAYRSEAGTTMGKVWDNVGCFLSSPWYKKSGYVKYMIPKSTVTSNYLCVRYSKWGSSLVPIEIFINGIKKGQFYPKDQGSWNSFTEEWISLTSAAKSMTSIESVQNNLTSDKGKQIKLYPVPCKDFLVMDLSDVGTDLTIQVFDSYGKSVKQINNASSNVEVYLAGQRNGWYFYRILKDGQQITSGKFVKK